MWTPFHHPDISLPVIRRRFVEFSVEVMVELAVFSTAPVRWLLSPDEFTSRAAYDNALQRMRKRGLIVTARKRGDAPALALDGRVHAAAAGRLRPEKYWNARWNKIWYVLVYDVPESDRAYREMLRRFLRQQRLGCLQGSVWITPRDIRPEYDDLVKAAGADAYAVLFESRTVLGQSGRDLVDVAWNFERLSQIQRRYGEVYRDNLQRLKAATVPRSAVAMLAREAVAAYQAALAEDPLLPRALWPAGYLGPQVVGLHRKLMRRIAQSL